jgi:RNA polymerase sigma-70 factor, ECF subfamily
LPPLPRLTLIAEPAPDDAEDAALANALIRRDPDATFVAWTRLAPFVERTLRRLMGPDAELRDLSQDVFLRFFAAVPKLRDPSALRSFMIGICLRVVRHELRHRWMRRFLHLTSSGEPPEIAAPEPDREGAETVRRYYAVLDQLGGQERSLYTARHIEELPLADVAAAHRLSISTARRRLIRIGRRVAALVARDPALAAYLAQVKTVGSR